MNNRIIINKLDKIQNLDNLIQNIPLNSFENSSEDDFNILKIDGENMNENLEKIRLLNIEIVLTILKSKRQAFLLKELKF